MYTFTTKLGKQIIFRHLKISDVKKMTKYINDLSKENTFVTFSGEKITYQEEKEHVIKSLNEIKNHDKVVMLGLYNEIIIGVSNITRNTSDKKRGLHVANLGISVHKNFRNQGIGRKLMEITIREAVNNIYGLKQIQLECYSPNVNAIKMYKKVGFKECGRIPKAIFYKGMYVDKVIMSYQVCEV